MREQQHNSFHIFVGNNKSFSYYSQNLEVTCDTVLQFSKFVNKSWFNNIFSKNFHKTSLNVFQCKFQQFKKNMGINERSLVVIYLTDTFGPSSIMLEVFWFNFR